jgi:hypothetical protein
MPKKIKWNCGVPPHYGLLFFEQMVNRIKIEKTPNAVIDGIVKGL